MTKATAARQPQATAAPEAPPAQTSKKQQVISLLEREAGATLADIVTLTGWLPHTARAALTGLRKGGFNIESSKVEGVTRYCVATDGAKQ